MGQDEARFGRIRACHRCGHSRVFASLDAVGPHLAAALDRFERNTGRIRRIHAWPWMINPVFNANLNHPGAAGGVGTAAQKL